MKELKELAKIVTETRLDKVETLFNLNKTSHSKRLGKITQMIASEQLKSDGAVANELGLQEKSSAYRMFKMRLRNKLLNTFLFLDLDKRTASTHARKVYECSVNLHAVRMLLMFGVRNYAIQLAKSTLKNAEEHELFEFCLSLCLILRSNTKHTESIAEFRVYDKKVKYFLACLSVEEDIEARFEAVAIWVQEPKSDSFQIEKAVREALEVLEKQLSIYNTFRLNLYHFRLKGISLQQSRSFDALQVHLEKFELYVQKNLYKDSEARLGEVHLQLMLFSLYSGNLDLGNKYIAKVDLVYPKGSLNWMLGKELAFYIRMHKGEYLLSSKIVHEVFQTKRNHQEPNIEEKWDLFKLYNDFASNINSKQKESAPSAMNEKVHKNQLKLTKITADKQGFNVAFRIIEFMQHVKYGDFGMAIDQMEALFLYSKRYLTNQEGQRNSIFIKMLKVSCQENFNFKATRKKTASLYEMLKTEATCKSLLLERMEIIPLENLWQLYLNVLRYYSYAN